MQPFAVSGTEIEDAESRCPRPARARLVSRNLTLARARLILGDTVDAPVIINCVVNYRPVVPGRGKPASVGRQLYYRGGGAPADPIAPGGNGGALPTSGVI